MYQPNRAQWVVLWAVTLFIVLAWPPDKGRSLGLKALSWAVDPRGSLPALPPPLPVGLDDDGDAVAAHDGLERDYFYARERGGSLAWRMRLKEFADPIDPQTERQILVGVAAAAALVVWKLGGPKGKK